MGKRAEEPEKENVERWLLSYSNLVTLVMLIFIVLYSMSALDMKKYQAISGALADVFADTSKKKEQKDRLEEELRKVIHGNKFQVTETADGLSITMFSDARFNPGESKLSEEEYQAICRLAPALAAVPNQIRVEGHTDAVPISAETGYASNWELSSRRALAVLGALESHGVPSTRLAAAAYGSVRPLRPNDTPEGRSYNRRVEIKVLFDPNAGALTTGSR